MLEVSLTAATEADVVELATNMRDIDILECSIFSSVSLKDIVQSSVNMSYEAMAGRVNGELVAIFGVVKQHTMSSEAIPWLLATPKIEKYAFTFARCNKKVIARWKSKFTVMHNYIHADNIISIHWLKWLGFEIGEPKLHSDSGEMFRLFEMRG